MQIFKEGDVVIINGEGDFLVAPQGLEVKDVNVSIYSLNLFQTIEDVDKVFKDQIRQERGPDGSEQDLAG